MAGKEYISSHLLFPLHLPLAQPPRRTTLSQVSLFLEIHRKEFFDCNFSVLPMFFIVD